MSHCDSGFEIDDSAITKRGFTCHSTYPVKFTGNNFILTNTDTLCVKVYSNNQAGDCFAVGFGQFFGKGWIHVVSEESGTWDSTEYAEQHIKQCAQVPYDKMLARAPEHARSMDKVRSAGRACFMHQTRLRRLTLRTCVVWKSSRENEVKLEVFRDPSFDYVPGEWTGFDVDVGGIFLGSVHYFRIIIDIIHRKQNIKLQCIATPHSNSVTVQSLRGSSPAAHTQRNSQEIHSL